MQIHNFIDYKEIMAYAVRSNSCVEISAYFLFPIA